MCGGKAALRDSFAILLTFGRAILAATPPFEA
jgi:hypothetical protein